MKQLIKKILGEELTNKVRPYVNEIKEKKRTHFYSQFIKEGDLCFDIGANIGSRTKPFLNLKAKVIAVEPQESCYKILEEKFGDNITIVKKGVGDQEGEKNFYIADSPLISSFSEDWIDDVKKKRFKDYTWNEPVKTEITTLDTLIREFGKPAFIKIDVEGYELEVLKGLTQPVKALSFEYTVPEQTDLAIECIRQIEKNDKHTIFNYSERETMKLTLNQWISADEMCKIIKTDKFIKSLAGDIYVLSNNI